MLMETAKVLSNNLVTGEYRVLILTSPQIGPQAQPGQFVHLRVPHLAEAVLRRPFSIFKTDGATLSLLYKCIGKGTQAMARLRAGDTISLMGPLGKGFPPIGRDITPVLVAGGYGMAALYLLARQAPVKGIVFAGGARTEDILCTDDFETIGWQVRVTTEDGSRGKKGRVTKALDAWLRQNRTLPTPIFFACGPMGMLQAVAQRAQAGGWKAWLSLDRHMGCGLGACLACVQKVRVAPSSPRKRATAKPEAGWTWARICTEGPVFECREILWDEA